MLCDCAAEAGILQSPHKEYERVEDVVSWETVVERYIELHGGQPDCSDHTK